MACAMSIIASHPAAARPTTCEAFDQARVVSHEGDFLGILAGQDEATSIYNTHGAYGSRYSGTSIWNPTSNFGGPYANQSAFNDSTSTPPMLLKDGKIVGRLTKNKYVAGGVDPVALKLTCFND